MDIIIKLRNRLECKINYTLPALLPNKLNTMRQGLAASGENIRSKREIPALAMSWPDNQGILFFYISKTLEMIWISFMASLLNAVL